MTAPVKALVKQQTRDDDETTAVQLHTLLLRHGHTMTVLRCRAALGWTLSGSAYCQLIRQQNKVRYDNVILSHTVCVGGGCTCAWDFVGVSVQVCGWGVQA